MVAGRETLDVQFDANAVRHLRKRGGSNTLSFGILKVDGHRFGRGRRIGFGHPASPNQKAQTHQTHNRSHGPSLLSLDAPAMAGTVVSNFTEGETCGETRCSYSATSRFQLEVCGAITDSILCEMDLRLHLTDPTCAR